MVGDYTDCNDCVSKRRSTGKIGESTLRGDETTLKSGREFRAEIRSKDVTAELFSDFDQFLVRCGGESGKGDVKGSRCNRIEPIRAIKSSDILNFEYPD